MKHQRWHIYPVLSLLAILFTGCGIPSVHPLYEPEDLIGKPQLSGTWQNDKGTKVYDVYSISEVQNNNVLRDSLGIKENDSFLREFTKQGLENLYLILEPDTNPDPDPEVEYTAVYLGGLLKINETHYLDLYKYHPSGDVFFYPVHVFVKVNFETNKLIMHEFREGWLRDLIKNRQIRIKHEISFDNLLLTAPTDDLQQFISKYGDDPEAYSSDKRIFTRITTDE